MPFPSFRPHRHAQEPPSREGLSSIDPRGFECWRRCPSRARRHPQPTYADLSPAVETVPDPATASPSSTARRWLLDRQRQHPRGSRFADRTRVRRPSFSLNYRLHRRTLSAAVYDATTAYRWLLKRVFTPDTRTPALRGRGLAGDAPRTQ